MEKNRLNLPFQKRKTGILNVYCTAGFPNHDSTLEVMKAIQSSGADIIELGMPYSDPLADGPVIQQSSQIALANGMTINVLFEQLQDFRETIHIPVILMGYLNPIIQFGFEKFCQHCKAVGIDGLIIPDLPAAEFEDHYQHTVQQAGLEFVFLITPETSESRIRKLDELSTGFLYAVSSSSLTGTEKNFNEVEVYLQRLQSMKLKNPILVGFGIKDRDTFASAARYAQGAIIGSAYIQAIAKSDNIALTSKQFLNSVLGEKVG